MPLGLRTKGSLEISYGTGSSAVERPKVGVQVPKDVGIQTSKITATA